jgi:cytochrome c-type biogenesis protein CcmH
MMIFWLAVAVLAALVTYAVTRPLLTNRSASDDTAGADIAVYKDQLQEIDAEQARGTLSEQEAEAARAEVGRRLLRRAESDASETDGASAASPAAVAPGSRRPLALHTVLSLVVPVASLAIYLGFGNPGLPGQPLSARLETPPTSATADELVARVEAALRKNPDDGRGWDVIGPVYMAQRRYDDAARAYASAIRLSGVSEGRLRGFAEAMIRRDNGIVGDDARRAFNQILSLNPDSVEPRFWLAMAKEQDGDKAGAIADYKAMLENAPEDAGWRQPIAERLAALERGEAPGIGAPAPAQNPVADALANATAEQRQAMIRDMVQGLSDRLKAEPNDPNGWLMLIRSYHTLGQNADAAAALLAAREALAGNEKGLERLKVLADELGLKS